VVSGISLLVRMRNGLSLKRRSARQRNGGAQRLSLMAKRRASGGAQHLSQAAASRGGGSMAWRRQLSANQRRRHLTGVAAALPQSVNAQQPALPGSARLAKMALASACEMAAGCACGSRRRSSWRTAGVLGSWHPSAARGLLAASRIMRRAAASSAGGVISGGSIGVAAAGVMAWLASAASWLAVECCKWQSINENESGSWRSEMAAKMAKTA